MKKTLLCLTTLLSSVCFANTPPPLLASSFLFGGTPAHTTLSTLHPSLSFTNDTSSTHSFYIDLPPIVTIGMQYYGPIKTNGGTTLSGCATVSTLAAGESAICDVAAGQSITVTFDASSCPSSDNTCYAGTYIHYRLM